LLAIVSVVLLSRTIGELVAKNQSVASRLQNSLDRLAGVSAENQSLKAALKTSAFGAVKPGNTETCRQHRGNAPVRYNQPVYQSIDFYCITKNYSDTMGTSKAR